MINLRYWFKLWLEETLLSKANIPFQDFIYVLLAIQENYQTKRDEL
jgi:hypothetical protein